MEQYAKEQCEEQRTEEISGRNPGGITGSFPAGGKAGGINAVMLEKSAEITAN